MQLLTATIFSTSSLLKRDATFFYITLGLQDAIGSDVQSCLTEASALVYRQLPRLEKDKPSTRNQRKMRC